MNNAYRKEIPPRKKAETVKEVWSGKKSLKEACRELGITKQAYYKWEKKVEAALEKTLERDRQGRRPKNHVADENLRHELEKVRHEKKQLEKEKKKLERKKVWVEGELCGGRIRRNV